MYVARKKLFDQKQFENYLGIESDKVSLFRETIDQGRLNLKSLYESGLSAPIILGQHSSFIDKILSYAWELHGAQANEERMALVAVGGYGRSELHPYSDIDLMILLDKNRYQQVKTFVESFLSFLWDIGLEVGHSVRSISDCVKHAKQDITVATNIMESRLIQGSNQVFLKMIEETSSKKIWKPDAFFEAKLNEQTERHLKYEDTAYDLEPNIKEGPGGIRDIQTVTWVLARRYGINDLKQLIQIGYLTGDECQQLIRGRNFLWKLRIGLHHLAGRGEDRLLFHHQRALAQQYGYADNSNHLAVEQLMKRYYRAVKELRIINEILLQHYQDENRRSKKDRIKILNDRFQSKNGFLEIREEDTFKQTPQAILELFLLLQQKPQLKGVTASTIRALRANLGLIDSEFRKAEHIKDIFMDIMRQPHGQTHALRRMNNYGVLGVYIPVFGAIVGQMQHDLFHVYTVDAHSLFVVRNLRRFALDKHKQEMPLANRVMMQIAKPERLYLAGLFHDIAKGRGGDHSILGEADALKFCRLHGMSDYDSRFVAWLVRHHLFMSHVAQRKDITDSEVIREFSKTVGDQEHLNNLYLLTIADIRGTSPHVWNAWKGRLLEDLYHAATRYIRHGLETPQDADERIEDIKQDVLHQILQNNKKKHALIEQERIDHFWEGLPPDYFLRHNAKSLSWHIESIASTQAIDLPLVQIHYEPRLEALVFLIFAPESESLLSVVTGGFERLNLNIVDAKTHTTSTGFALYTFVALEQDDQQALDKQHLQQLQGQLRQIVVSGQDNPPTRSIQIPRKLQHFNIEPKVSFSQSPNEAYTVMEVVATDQPGLLHRVSRCLLHCKVRLVTAKIATFGERVEDVFFITNRDGKPVTDNEQMQCLKTSILSTLAIPESKEKAAAANF